MYTRSFLIFLIALTISGCIPTHSHHAAAPQSAPEPQDCIDTNKEYSPAYIKMEPYEGYIDEVKEKLRRVGNLNAGHSNRIKSSKISIIQVRIDRHGLLKEAKVASPSCDPKANEQFIKIIRMAAPFSPFPNYSTIDESSFEVKMIFDPSK
ncbi:TonB C-terminal domain-containing protein [Aquipseudomonas campi]|uniref:TonB C-terminal domain-containing protein n=1 Tax=Aquipseudomonas campi TaxID=2731681 RepID=A0A6M8F8D7_9GAMM|nr:TonB C-terminal domain-containing protein [Pseudomonas campi]QKE62483.1 TonB C-terminal domain-containing protein [Pseudomonas campi]